MSSQSSSSGSTPRKGSSWILTTAGALLVAGILVALNVISGLSSARLDLTENKVHTLTEGTRNILGRVDSEVALKLFVSPMDDLDPSLRPTVADVEGWLARYREMKPDLLSVQKFVVEPASDEEQAAARAGIEPRQGMYFGLGITCADRDAAIPWVPEYMPPAGAGEERIEYALSAAITEVTRTKKKTIGIMSPLALAGNQNPFGGGGTPTWGLYQVLKEQYEVKTVDVKASSIEDGIDVLLLVHPAGITDEAQWAVDQYLLKGGRVVAFLDSYSLIAAQSGQQRNPMMGGNPDAIPTSSNLSRLLGSWGYEFNAGEIVADMNFQTQFGQNVATPVLLTLGQEAINKNDAVTESLSDFWFIYSGAFTGSPASGIEEERFLTTSRNNQMVSTSYAQAQPNTPDGIAQLQRLNRSFSPSGTEKLLAFRLRGKFKTAFPEGKPSAPPPDDDDGPPATGFGPRGPEGETGAAAPDGESGEAATPPVASDALPQLPTPDAGKPETPASDAAGETKTDAPPANTGANTGESQPADAKSAEGPSGDSGSLKEATAEGVVYLVADSDMLADFISPMIARNSNIPLALNIIDQAAGDLDLIAVRSRGSSRRPFSYINRIEEEANAKIRQDINAMQSELDKINDEINSKKTAKERNEAIFAGLRDFEQKRRELNGMIYEKQKSARKDVNSKKDTIKWVNILLMPVIVALLGILVLVLRKTKTTAR